ncbi:MAG: hypothetical protein KA792_09530 [Bacteroidales bacterium]|nr:hypothetical protein [Bacteroidales bacterium]
MNNHLIRRLSVSAILIIMLAALTSIIIFAFSYNNSDTSNRNENLFDFFAIITYIILGITIIAIVIISTIAIFNKALRSKHSLLIAGFTLFILIIIYLLSYPDYSDFYFNNNIGRTGSKIIGSGIISVFALLVITVLTAIFYEIKKSFKK